MSKQPHESRGTAQQPAAEHRPTPRHVTRAGVRIEDLDARQRVALSLILRPDAPRK
jgi:hypothetical protein